MASYVRTPEIRAKNSAALKGRTPSAATIASRTIGLTAMSASERSRRQLEQHPERWYAMMRASVLRRTYGITIEEWDAMFTEQGGLCAICHRPETATLHGVVKRLAVDHDHITGTVRGLLCQNCNRAIGLLGHDPARLRQAAEYLAITIGQAL
jgi:hypothetical protein